MTGAHRDRSRRRRRRRDQAGTPVGLRFDRQENSDGTSPRRVPGPGHERVAGRIQDHHLDPDIAEPGLYSWACGMNMLHGTLVADSPGGDAQAQDAAGALYSSTGALVSPMISAAATTISSISVVLNSARLNRSSPPVLPAAQDTRREPVGTSAR